jgi:hypothetical protein
MRAKVNQLEARRKARQEIKNILPIFIALTNNIPELPQYIFDRLLDESYIRVTTTRS